MQSCRVCGWFTAYLFATHNSACCCGIGLWFGAVIIELNEMVIDDVNFIGIAYTQTIGYTTA
jgi:hypothetical protein